MKRPNFLAYVDFASTDVSATGDFYDTVLGWKHDRQMEGLYHRMLPGGFFTGSDGKDSEIRHLHMGIFDAANARPHPETNGVEPRTLASEGRRARIWVEVSPDDSHDRIIAEAEKRGATILWRNHIFTCFGGLTDAFRDPWNNEVVIWTENADSPDLAPHITRE
ncbi:VOC family protein [Stakelama sp. CBK3Z-3]|uniref:VOC family protein n=2 Tax=Stakelama flava TaxID=2860338 RepID=A0ABS6XR70_9SPHN|nr:VOC family protein [Stakelama flava]